jgi:hypothetical protein
MGLCSQIIYFSESKQNFITTKNTFCLCGVTLLFCYVGVFWVSYVVFQFSVYIYRR